MKLTQALLNILADGRFHSGSALGEATGKTRAAVWKAIQRLQASGVDIYSVRGKGYRLAEPIELLDKDAIVADLRPSARQALANLEIYSEIDSTNAYLLEIAKHSKVSGYACLAERQSAGRGRRGRTWVSPFGGNLYLSLLWRFSTGAAQLGGLSLAMAVAVAWALQDIGLAQIGLKWPNDILAQGRKLAGILLEVAGEAAGPCAVVIGLGLNIRAPARAMADVDQPWTDLASLLPGPVPRNALVSRILERLIEAINRFEQDGLRPFLADWRARDVFAGKAVTLQLMDRAIHGVMQGVDASGALLLQRDQGVERFHSGEVSLRARVV